MLRFRIVKPAKASSALVALSTVVAMLALAALPAAPAFATGPGLPRTYDAQRVDAPNTLPSGNFGLLVVNGGDLNGDKKDDLLVPQGTDLLSDGEGAVDGEIQVISGADGSLIRTIPAPDKDPVASGNRRPAFGASVSKFGDIGSCPQGEAGKLCHLSEIGPSDGVPEILASAINVDVGTVDDIGRVYLIDGASGAVLKRIDMPAADRAEQAALTEQLGSSSPERVRPRFGRTALSPAGLVPCDGSAGIGPCAAPSPVTIGDLDGGGRPDIVVGAPFVKDEESTNPTCNDTPAADVCERSGRLYMYRGEEITNTPAGRDPGVIESTPTWNVKNPLAQSDPPNPTLATEPELFGYSVVPLGDVGKCKVAVPAPGRRCPSADIGQEPDDRPEVLVSAPRLDSSGVDSGAALLLDGETGALLHTYLHPEPQAASLFGLTISQLAPGNLGDTDLPDVFLPAIGQNVRFRGQGRGYVLNGQRTTADAITLATLNDPAPQASGGFGASSAGVGDLAGDPRNEILVGELSSHSPPQNPNTISDVHIFDPLTEQVLQTIADPDQQAVSNFGASVAPLGDLNGDGFLDLAVGAGRFEVTSSQPDTGRLYIFRSNNTPPPPVSPPSAEELPQEGFFEGDFGDFGFFEEDFGAFDETAAASAGRSVTLKASKARVSLRRKGRRAPRVRLTGKVRASVNEELCEPSQRVLLQRRRGGGSRRLRRYRTFQRTRTSSSGAFKSKEFRPARTYLYRAVVPETEECPAAVSNQVKITVSGKAKRSPRRPRK
jgi:hypothetical protein